MITHKYIGDLLTNGKDLHGPLGFMVSQVEYEVDRESYNKIKEHRKVVKKVSYRGEEYLEWRNVHVFCSDFKEQEEN